MSIPTDIVGEELYLVSEPGAEYKSEYRDGRIIAMTGATPAHSLITGNIYSHIHRQLQGKPCRAYTSDTRIKVAAARFYTYPDLSVVCDAPVFDPRDTSALINPVLIVEVLSPSTEAYDRGQKFTYYKKLDSLREYVLIAQNRIRVERFSRQSNGEWSLVQLTSRTDVLELPSIRLSTDASLEVRVSVGDIYDKVDIRE